MATQTSVSQGMELKGVLARLLVDNATLGELHGLEQKDMNAIYAMAYNLYNHGKYKDALEVFKFLSFYNHLEKKYFMGVGACRQMLKDFNGAVEAYGYAAMLDVEDPKVHLHAAECFLALQRFEDAGNALHSVLHVVEERPAHAPVRDRAATLLQLLGNNEEEGQEVSS